MSQILNAVLQRMDDYKMYLCHTQSSFKYLCLYLLSFFLILFVDHLQSIGNLALFIWDPSKIRPSVFWVYFGVWALWCSPIYSVLDFYHLHFDSDPGLEFVFDWCLTVSSAGPWMSSLPPVLLWLLSLWMPQRALPPCKHIYSHHAMSGCVCRCITKHNCCDCVPGS